MSERNILITVSSVVFSLCMIVLLNTSSSASGESLMTIIDRETALTKLENLKAELKPLVEKIPADMTVILSDLNIGETITVGSRQNFVSASLYKLFVAYYAYGQIDEGKIAFDTILSNGRTLDSCLDVMITLSDNECGVLLGEFFGWDNIDTMILANGFTGTTLDSRNSPGSDLMTTSDDVNSFFTRLYNGELMSENHAEHLMNLLLNQEINDRLPPILPTGIAVAHKTGDVYDYIHDAGIIFSEDRDYSFVIMSAQWDEDMTFGPGYAYFQEVFSMIFSRI